MKRAIVLIGLLIILALPVWGQTEATFAKIPFDFVVAGATLPAGDYEFAVLEANTLTIRNVQTRKAVFAPILTQLAAAPGGGRITFDEFQEKKTLEAVWPLAGDGYLLHVTKEKHSHKHVKARPEA